MSYVQSPSEHFSEGASPFQTFAVCLLLNLFKMDRWNKSNNLENLSSGKPGYLAAVCIKNTKQSKK